jgi:hypothetical protein
LPLIRLPLPPLPQVGDVLYLPRGTIHQAVAHEESSSHLTISTFQRWTAADLLQYTVSVALANTYLQPRLPLPLKSGLPLRVLDSASLDAGEAAALAEASGGFGNALQALLPLDAVPAGGGGGAKAALAAQLAAACRSLADCLEGNKLGPQLLSTAGDAMAEDFMENRCCVCLRRSALPTQNCSYVCCLCNCKLLHSKLGFLDAMASKHRRHATLVLPPPWVLQAAAASRPAAAARPCTRPG